jgi:branched-chain amino acid transport system ATP-binding protein
MAEDCILETTGLVKEFRGFVAVNGVDLKVRRGHIHALIGPNGAGKTTCFNLLTKFLEPTRGQIRFNGIDITVEAPQTIARRGIVRSFQISAVFPHLTVLENVRIALQRKLGTSFHFWKSDRSLNLLNDRAMELLTAVDLAGYADMVTVEMHEDVHRVMELIKQVSANRTILMVEHNMKVVAGISDTLTVLARGSVLAEGPYAEVAANPLVIEAYMGTEADELASPEGH